MRDMFEKLGLTILSLFIAFALYFRVDIIHKGGPVMICIIVCSIFALTIIIERFWLLYKIRLDSSKFLETILDILKKRQIKEAIEACDKTPHPIGMILKSAILKIGKTREKIKEAVEDASLYEVPRLEKNMSLLATLAHICPLLGLLGTVIGLAECFQVIQAKSLALQSINLSDLASGVWVALVTTIGGLLVAIPAYVAYNFLVNRINNLILEMERSATELLNFLTENNEPE